MKRMLGIGAATVAVCGVLAAAAGAASPWHQVTGTNGGNNDQVGLLRTSDGTLHVVWQIANASSSDLNETPISSAGVVGSTTTIYSAWASLDNPALIPSPGGGMDVLFGGIRTINPGETNQDLNSAISTDGGATWTLQPGDAAHPGSPAYASPISATAVGSALVPYETWYGTEGVFVHTGLSPTTPNYNYQPLLGPVGCCGYLSNIASNAAGTIWLDWYSNATGNLGLYAQQVAADGAPVGSPVNMPSTSNMSVGDEGQTPLVADTNGQFYISYATGYPSFTAVRLWQPGSAGTTTIANVGSSGGDVTTQVAAAPDGRLWVMWKEDVSDSPRVFAVRSNKTVTRWGAVVDAGAPPGAAAGYVLNGNVTSSSLDLLGSFARGTSSSVATWYRRVLPGLTLTAKPGKLHKGVKTKVTFVVSDAGDAVKGAHVKAAGQSGKTNKNGKVTLTLTSTKKVNATASDSGYTGAQVTLKVVH